MSRREPDRVAVIGYGVTGQAAVRYLVAQGIKPIVIDTRTRPNVSVPNQCECYFEQQSWPEVTVSEAILSPGLAMNSCLVRGARAAGVRLVSDIDWFFRNVSVPVLGITGTNGKSTVTSWATHCLNQSKLRALAGGNLGEAALDLLSQEADVYVLELSSFQLERSDLHAYATACLLNVSADHLDLHEDMQDYVKAKQRIAERALKLVFNRQDPLTQPAARDAKAISFGLDQAPDKESWGLIEDAGDRYLSRGSRRLLNVADLPLAGEHNVQNALATAALVDQFVDDSALVVGLKTFTGLPHRFEQVAVHNGVSYINDSKATNVGATAAALMGFSANQRIVLVAGGDAKGADLNELVEVLQARVHTLVVLGRDAPKFEDLAQQLDLPCWRVTGMQQAVDRAQAEALPGDTVLLSPACSSLDMFSNYIERGEQFCEAVHHAIKGAA